jgi:hypothetical protein
MNKLRWYGFLAALLLLTPSSPALAVLGYQTWGVRGGVGVDPDQGIIGVHWNFGNFSKRTRLQPNVELGFGDNSTVGSLAIPVHYRFGNSPDFTPYAGGGILLGYIDRDKPKDSSGDWFIEPLGVVGIEWPLSGGGDLFLELGISFGDAHDAKLMVGWMRRIR